MDHINTEMISSDMALHGSDPDSAERHTLLRETVSSLMKASGGAGRVRLQRGVEPGFDTKLWKEMADLGWLGIPVPEELGGLGLGLRDLSVVAHELGKWVAPEPLVASTALATGVVRRGDNQALKEKLLPPMMAGELCIALAWQEEVGNLAYAETVATRATRRDAGFVLNGHKRFVHGSTDGFIVTAMGEDGLVAYWVPGDAQGLTISRSQLADGSWASDLTLADVQVGPEAIVASGESARSALREAIDDALVVVSAELLGVMDAVLQQTIEYLGTRAQFGRPIGAFQAIQHRMVDLFIAKELASCALREAMETFEFSDDGERRAEAAARVKFRASRSAIAIARAAVHLHGAMGFTDECDVGLYLKRAIVLNAWLGNHDAHLQQLSNKAGWIERAWH